jgi:hypothetical protein
MTVLLIMFMVHSATALNHVARQLAEGGIMDYKSDPYDTSTYVNPNDTYVFSAEVEQGTDISSGDFQKSKDYYIEGAAVPIALFCIGFLSLIAFNICLCCGVAKICTSQKAATNHHYFASLLFVIFFVICFLATHLLYMGYSDVVDGFDVMRTATSAIGSGFDGMSFDSNNLDGESDLLQPLCLNYGCNLEATRLYDGVEYMLDDLEEFTSNSDNVNSGIDMLEMVVTLMMFVMYACLLIAMIGYIMTGLCCKANPKGAICCGNLSFFVVAFIGILWMIVTSITADYCYENPTVNTINALSASKGQMYVVWYSSCHSGFNPMHRYINHTTVSNQQVIDYVGSDTSDAANEIRNHTTLISGYLEDLTLSTHQSCSPIQAGWLSLLNEGVCDSFFQGVRVIWICEVAACISLFFLMVTGGIMGKNHGADETSVLPEGGDRPRLGKSGGGGGGEQDESGGQDDNQDGGDEEMRQEKASIEMHGPTGGFDDE